MHDVIRTRYRLCLATLIFLAPLQAVGMTVEPYTWQSIASHSDFFGVVRCISSEYANGKDQRGNNHLFFECVVIKSWKGAKADDSFSIYVGTDDTSFGPRGWSAEKGQLFFLVGTVQFSPGGSLPVSPGKYQQLYPGVVSYPAGNVRSEDKEVEAFLRAMGSQNKSVEEFENDITAFYELDAAQREFQAAKSIALLRLVDSGTGSSIHPESDRKSITDAKTLPELIDTLFVLKIRPGNLRGVPNVISSIVRMGREETWKAIQPYSDSIKQRDIEWIHWNLRSPVEKLIDGPSETSRGLHVGFLLSVAVIGLGLALFGLVVRPNWRASK